MWRRRLAFGGFLVGLLLGACIFNAGPEGQGPIARLAGYTAMPLLLLLSPFVFLMSAAGLTLGPILAQAVSAVATWTAAGYLAGFAADRR
ncbi:MAG: hypothetical protein Q8T11_17640 [Elusimicrobiota bacterium]|nr:hypothetical protein [Elusimicrobiota bacterium]